MTAPTGTSPRAPAARASSKARVIGSMLRVGGEWDIGKFRFASSLWLCYQDA
jgi:hypothetical protein